MGVKIKVSRSRTIEHLVDINWRTSKSGNLDIGLKGIISASISGEVEQMRGQSNKKIETVNYEVELNGEKHNRYKLIWTDIWCKGIVEFRKDNITQTLPFKYLEKAELEVVGSDEMPN